MSPRERASDYPLWWVRLRWVDIGAQRQSGDTMTTLENRPNTALLVIDVQNGVVDGNHDRDTVVANVGGLVEKARQERVPVVWVQHCSEELRGRATYGRSSPN